MENEYERIMSASIAVVHIVHITDREAGLQCKVHTRTHTHTHARARARTHTHTHHSIYVIAAM